VATGDDLLALLYEQHFERMLRFAYLLTGGRGAEDLVQEAFVKALRRWDRRAAPETFAPWVRTTILRLHLNALRRARRERAALVRMNPADVADPPMAEPKILDALRALPPRQRAAVVLRYYEDLPEAEVASRLGCKLGTAKALLHQGRSRLEQLLADLR
jgi:RNA polymerase sigma-70 factor (sigma-E family)